MAIGLPENHDDDRAFKLFITAVEFHTKFTVELKMLIVKESERLVFEKGEKTKEVFEGCKDYMEEITVIVKYAHCFVLL